jgi:hypothetical protein
MNLYLLQVCWKNNDDQAKGEKDFTIHFETRELRDRWLHRIEEAQRRVLGGLEFDASV